jgi:hypothetical protein
MGLIFLEVATFFCFDSEIGENSKPTGALEGDGGAETTVPSLIVRSMKLDSVDNLVRSLVVAVVVWELD